MARRFSLTIRLILPILSIFALAAALGCSSAKKPAASAEVKRYPLEGRVIAIENGPQNLTVDHKEIPGFMKAMLMTYPVRDKWALGVLKRGDYIHATLVVGDGVWLEDITITEAHAAAELSSTSELHIPEKGESVPDFAFVNQRGQSIRLSQFRGQPLLMTFVYSRCPLPNYCMRTSNNFAEVAKYLQTSNPAAFAKLQMLTVSIDPEFDTPQVLAKYGRSYAGKVDPELKHWSFGTGKLSDIRRATDFFGMSYNRQDGQIVHNLRTVLIDANGKIADYISGNDWKPAELAAEVAGLQK